MTTKGSVLILASVLFNFGFFVGHAEAVCPDEEKGFIELTIPSPSLENLCDSRGIGCDIIDGFESIQHFFVAFPEKITLILPVSETNHLIGSERVIRIDNMTTTWRGLARSLISEWDFSPSHFASFQLAISGFKESVILSDLFSINEHLLYGEIREEFPLIRGDEVKIPNYRERLSLLGPTKFRCS